MHKKKTLSIISVVVVVVVFFFLSHRTPKGVIMKRLTGISHIIAPDTGFLLFWLLFFELCAAS